MVSREKKEQRRTGRNILGKKKYLVSRKRKLRENGWGNGGEKYKYLEEKWKRKSKTIFGERIYLVMRGEKR